MQNDFNVYGKGYFKFEILQEYSTEKPLITQSHLILLEDAWIRLYRERNIKLYNIENSLEEILNGNKLLQIAPYMATNVLIGQIQKFYFHFNNQLQIFELKEIDKSNLGNKICVKPNLIETETNSKFPATINRFVKIPKEVILANILPEHRISALLYFNYNQTWENTVHYSPIYMIQWCKYKANWHRGTEKNIFTRFRDCMDWYFENGYITDFDKGKYIQNTFQSSLLNMEKINPKNNFGILYDFEIEAINKYQSPYKPLNKSILLLLLAYIKAFTWIRTNESSGHSEKSKKNKPEIFYSQFQTIAAFIGSDRKMIAKTTEVLEKLGLIKTHRMPRYKDSNDKWHTDDIIYICPYRYIWRNNQIVQCTKEEYDYRKELEYGIIFLRNQNYVSKKFYQD